MKAWRRSARGAELTPPILRLAQFTVISRMLVLTFDRDVLNPLPFTALTLRVWSGTNRYEWSNTVSVIGHVVTCQMAVGVGDGTPAQVQYITPPVSIIDEKGVPWAAGIYPVTII